MELNRAVTLWQKGDLAGAAGACAELLAVQPDNVNALQLLGTIHMQQGALEKARSVLERACSLAPNDVHVLNTLGLVHRRAGRLNDALPFFRKAVRLDPSLTAAYSNLGSTLFDLRRPEEARPAYRKLAQLSPQNPEAWAQLARLAELIHDSEDACRLAGRALELNPADVTANFVLARADLAEGRSENALDRLRPFADDPGIPAVNRAIAHGLVGQALEALGRFDAAFVAFGRANAELKTRFRGAFDAVVDPTRPEAVTALRQDFAQTPALDWPAGEFEGRAPVFLVGFPRSGTTLLDQILASHSKIATIEERPVLLEMFGELATSGSCTARLAALNDEEINGFRSAYWQAMAPYIDGASDAPVVVDKFPLNLVLLGVIARVFPDAKIIFALRDPRDVIMSC
ncbi:MAG: tetratricopeptide repeat protein, partial [Sphingomonadales bacterium]|nr:tetratricopeptide repeat protein [Sphingomonadales bacterium]